MKGYGRNKNAGRHYRRKPWHRSRDRLETGIRRRGGDDPLRRRLSRRAGGAGHQHPHLGLQGPHAQGRHGQAHGARQGDRGGGQVDGRHRCAGRQCRHHGAFEAGRSRPRDLEPRVRHQPARQLAAGQGGPSASQALQGRHRDAGLDGRCGAAASDRRLQPDQGGADHADGDDGPGMGARRHPRQRRSARASSIPR